MTSAKEQLAATGNSSFGYFGGGHPSTTSAVDRIDYANDTANAVVKGPLSDARKKFLSATGNADFGYFGGGEPGPVSTVDRIDYSNDTTTASPKGPLSNIRERMGATGNSSFGYFGAGEQNGPNVTTVDRIDYSNDTETASPKGDLTVARRVLAATSSRANAIPPLNTVNYAAGTAATPNTGYFGGSNSYNLNNRIDFDNDTATIVTKGTLDQGAGNNQAGTGNGTFGYMAGGTQQYRSSVNRISYLNDTAIALLKGPLNIGRRDQGGAGNANFGYVAGGEVSGGGNTSTVERIDYSDDVTTASPKGKFE